MGHFLSGSSIRWSLLSLASINCYGSKVTVFFFFFIIKWGGGWRTHIGVAVFNDISNILSSQKKNSPELIHAKSN